METLNTLAENEHHHQSGKSNEKVKRKFSHEENINELKTKVKDTIVSVIGTECKSIEKLENEVQDSSFWSWIVCLASMWTFGHYLGFEFNYGLLYSKFLKVYNTTDMAPVYAGESLKL
jgi:hypothetical protein